MLDQNTTTHWTKKLIPFIAVALFALTGCVAEKTQEGEMPEVDVDVESGELPEYDVETADVSVTTEEKQVEVPEVEVKTETKTIEVPDVDVDMPEEADENEGGGGGSGQTGS